jgi:hypothetical protein
VIAESLFAYVYTLYFRTATRSDLPGTSSLRGLLVQRVILYGLSGVLFAIAFTLLQNGLNRERRWWLSVVLVLVTVAGVNLLVSLATGTIPTGTR